MEIGSEIIRGHVDTIILNFLLSKDCYGYEMSKLITEKSGGRYTLKDPSLYSAMRRLEGNKFIEGYWGDETQGGRRKYYTITEAGKEALKQELNNWKFAKSVIDSILSIPKD